MLRLNKLKPNADRTPGSVVAAAATVPDAAVPPLVITDVKRARRRNEQWRAVKKRWPRLVMAMPAVVWLIIFAYIPMAGIIIAFKDYRFDKGILGSAWVGLANFRYLFGTQDAWRITFNTLFLNGIFIATTTVASIAVAILLFQVHRHFMSRFYQATLFLPYFISWVIAGVFVYALLAQSGVVNNILASLGLDKVEWYASPEYWPALLTVADLWKGVGFWSLVYFAGILAISPELYEAAAVDGATGWQMVFRITLPLLSPLIIINVILSIGRIFYADFGLFYFLTRQEGLLLPTTDVIDTYVFRALTKNANIGMASAAGLYQAAVGFTLVLVTNWFVRRIDPERSLF